MQDLSSIAKDLSITPNTLASYDIYIYIYAYFHHYPKESVNNHQIYLLCYTYIHRLYTPGIIKDI